MANHTKGPWCSIEAEAELISYIVAGPVKRVARAWRLADAQLIAAAPDLYAALSELVNSPNAKQNAMWDRARAALSKVEGK